MVCRQGKEIETSSDGEMAKVASGTFSFSLRPTAELSLQLDDESNEIYGSVNIDSVRLFTCRVSLNIIILIKHSPDPTVSKRTELRTFIISFHSATSCTTKNFDSVGIFCGRIMWVWVSFSVSRPSGTFGVVKGREASKVSQQALRIRTILAKKIFLRKLKVVCFVDANPCD